MLENNDDATDVETLLSIAIRTTGRCRWCSARQWEDVVPCQVGFYANEDDGILPVFLNDENQEIQLMNIAKIRIAETDLEVCVEQDMSVGSRL